MAPPVRSLQELITDNKVAPDENGTRNAKDLPTLAHLSYQDVLSQSFATQKVLKFLLRHDHAVRFSSQLLSLLLACYCMCRSIGRY